ncbi:MAG: UDP-3-O-(3-hydroxymyristoyl) N-acetylglucosamine deacetylase [bacterium ADurb.Bin425]|jgi:UDP-3-O-[3-hydroxymyristoyl] N-acetylglucosamine deacetylase|nr:MAG: UDP-3-O-(3-hydroxymyristoyl) N-acetylglucosamine deacetylase [bacterium ADurb.Bin425]
MAVAEDLRKKLDLGDRLASFKGPGLTSKQEVLVEIFGAAKGTGIVFLLPDGQGDVVKVPARADMVVNTLRNVVLGVDRIRLCIVEHFLCAAVLWGLDDAYVYVDGPEMPLGDGSSEFWIRLFEASGIARGAVSADLELKETITVERGDRSLIAIPAEKFSVTYLMDWKHPLIGQKWQSWDSSRDIKDIYENRTFGMLQEHKMLGLDKDVVSLTDDGFTMPLKHPDEPVRHKLLDLIGDLALVGVNPLRIKARFISIKGGHEMDVDIAGKLRKSLSI